MRIPADRSGPIHELLHARFPDTSNTNLRKWLKNDRVQVHGRVVSRFDFPVRAGQVVEVLSNRTVSVRPPCPILFRDRHLLAVEKPVGLFVSRDEGGDDTFYKRVQEYVRRTSEGASGSSSCTGWIGRPPASCSSP